jgi:hypothetical protein
MSASTTRRPQESRYPTWLDWTTTSVTATAAATNIPTAMTPAATAVHGSGATVRALAQVSDVMKERAAASRCRRPVTTASVGNEAGVGKPGS